MFNYTAYGLNIQSTLQIPAPEMKSETATVDVSICKGYIDRTTSEIHNSDEFLLRANSTEVCYFSPNLGAFLVRNGREIVVDGNLGVEEQVLGQFILNLPLPMLLHQRGLLILHASAVAMNGMAVAFLGQTGQGKSTIVAALHQHSYPLVTDDVLALSISNITPESESEVTVFPSYPQLRLWYESVFSLGETLEMWNQVYPNYNKLARSVTNGFYEQFLPLKRIYILGVGNLFAIEPLSPTEAFQEITGQSYPTTEISKATGNAALKFQQCAKLASCVSIYRLRRPQDLSTLSELVKLVEEDISKSDK